MSSSKKGASGSAKPSPKHSSPTAGWRHRDAPSIFDSFEKDWAVKRIENMEKLLRRCERDPMELLAQVRVLLQEQVASHDKAGRTSDSLFYARLNTYVYNLRMDLEHNP